MAFSLKSLEREVVIKRTAITAVITGALHVVVALHWLTVAQSDQTIKSVTAAIDLLGAGVGAAFVRAGVSPASDSVPLAPSGLSAETIPASDYIATPAPSVPVIAEARNPNSTV